MGTRTLPARGVKIAVRCHLHKCIYPNLLNKINARVGRIGSRHASSAAAVADGQTVVQNSTSTPRAKVNNDLTKKRHVADSHVALQGVRLGYSRKEENQQVTVASHPPMKVYNLQSEVLTHTLVKQMRTELRANNLDTDGTRVIVLRQDPEKKGPTLLTSEHKVSKTNSLALRNQFELCDDILHSRPVFAVLEGNVTDAGAAVAASCYHRVATNNSSFQARSPSSGLLHGGMLPLLASLDNYMAEYLTLTGFTLQGRDLFTSGISTVYVPYERLELLYQRLPMLLTMTPDTIQAALCEFAEPGPRRGTLDFKTMELMRACFHARNETIDDILRSLATKANSPEINQARAPELVNEDTLMSEEHTTQEKFAINAYNQIRLNVTNPKRRKELEISLRMIRETRQLSAQSRMKYAFRVQMNVTKMGLRRNYADYLRTLDAEQELCLPEHASLEQKMARVARTIDDVAEDAILSHLNKFGDRYGGEESEFATGFIAGSKGEREYASIPANMKVKEVSKEQTGYVDDNGSIQVTQDPEEDPDRYSVPEDREDLVVINSASLNDQGEPLQTYIMSDGGTLEVHDYDSDDNIVSEISDMEESADEGAAVAAVKADDREVPLYRKFDEPEEIDPTFELMEMNEVNVFHTPGAKGVITHSEFWHAVSQIKRRKKNKYGLGFCSQFDVMRRLSHRLQIPGNRAQLDSLFSVDDGRKQDEKVLYSVNKNERHRLLREQIEEEQHLLNKNRQQIVNLQRNKLKAKRNRHLTRKQKEWAEEEKRTGRSEKLEKSRVMRQIQARAKLAQKST